jgi:hypothetical protein
VLPGSPEGLEVAGGKDEVMSVLCVGTLWPSPDRGPERGGGYWGGSLLGSLQGRPHLSPLPVLVLLTVAFGLNTPQRQGALPAEDPPCLRTAPHS